MALLLLVIHLALALSHAAVPVDIPDFKQPVPPPHCADPRGCF
jgi:hypothetical protein